MALQCIISQLNLVRKFIIVDWFRGTDIVFLGVSKYYDLPSMFADVSNLFLVFGIDKVLICIRSYVEVFLPPVITCDVLYTELYVTKNVVFGDG